SNLNFGTGAFSLSFWVNPAAYGSALLNKGSNAFLPVGNRSGFFLFLEASGQLRAEISSWDSNNLFSQILTNSTVPLRQWSHISFVRTATSMTFYINGVAQSFTTGGNATPSQITSISTSAPFRIGARDGNSTIGDLVGFYKGQMDEVTVHNRALSQAEIQAEIGGGTYTQTGGTSTIVGTLSANSLNIQGGTMALGGTTTATGGISLWKAENSAGDSINGNAGTLGAGVNYTSSANGKIGQAFSFDGSSNGIVSLPNTNTGNLDLTGNQFSVECWIYQTDASQAGNPFGSQFIFWKHNGS